jgi:hypothetical protein
METIRENEVTENIFFCYERGVFFFKERLVQPKKISTNGKQTYE